MSDSKLSVRGVSKSFDHHLVLDQIDLDGKPDDGYLGYAGLPASEGMKAFEAMWDRIGHQVTSAIFRLEDHSGQIEVVCFSKPFAEYEQVVLQALEESRTALDAYAAANREFAAHERRAQAAADAAGVVFVQYREGLVDSLARTQADRDAISGALDANRALTTQRLTVVDVYRALGGGWR